MYAQILVPLDGSVFAESALPHALSLAEKTKASVRLAMVNEPVDLPPGVWAEAFLANHAHYLDTITESVRSRAAPGVSVSSTLLEGEVSKALAAEADVTSELIVMSTHGHGGISRMWLGSVADELLRLSPVPVLLIRPQKGEEGAAPEEVKAVRHIVVALDGTPFGEQAIEPALALAESLDAATTLLRAVAFPAMISSYMPDTVQGNDAFVAEAEGEARSYLEQLKGELGLSDKDVHYDVRVTARPANGIMEYAESNGADLIAMASHARHGVSRAVLGSVADKVVRGSHVPVLIVHPSTDDARSDGTPAHLRRLARSELV